MKTYLRLLAPLVALNCASFAADLQTYHVRAERVLDGDTAICVVTDGRFRNTKLKVRLAGVDAPEMKVNRNAPGQSFALDAKMYLEQITDTRPLRLTVTGTDHKRGMVFGVLDYWILDKKLVVNAEMVRAGFADVYDPTFVAVPYEARAPIELAQSEAQTGKKGIWSLAKRERPADYRKRLASD